MALRRLTTSWIVLLAASFLLATAPRAEERHALGAALNSITSGELQAHVEVLADDAFEGREAGSRGGRAAGAYLWSQCQKYGLKGGGDNGGYFQQFDGAYRNVLGLIEGSDPQLKHEVVIVGAHYDHVGYGNSRNSYGPLGHIHNGADDNASGVAALLEIIDAFARLPNPPKRTVLVAFWDGEEKGLLGSRHWISHPTVPLRQVALAINVDMIGRLRRNRVEVYGARTGYGLRQLVSRQNRNFDFDFDFSWELKDNSDHYPFYAQGVPVLMLHTGLHEDYHRPSDEAHKINAEGLEKVARLLFSIVYESAQRPQRTVFRAASRKESPPASRPFQEPSPPRPPRLGVWWRNHGPHDGELLLTRVAAGSAAEQAGLRNGDRLIRFGGRPIADERQLRLAILAAEGPVQVVVRRPGLPEPLEVTVQLTGNPVRLGIAWREDDAEPGTVVLTQVVPGSAAALAGLRAGDRVYEIGGRTFRDSGEFSRLAASPPSPVEILIERRGRLQRVELEVWALQ